MKISNIGIILPAALVLSALAAEPTYNHSLRQIVTQDGRVYLQVEPQRVDPDGLVINYQPVPGGIGCAKVKFRDLPEDLQKKYGYDEGKAADFQKQQAETASAAWARVAEQDALARYRDFAELNRALAGDAAVSYSVSMDGNGKISAWGSIQPVPSQTSTNIVNFPPYGVPKYRDGLFNVPYNGLY